MNINKNSLDCIEYSACKAGASIIDSAPIKLEPLNSAACAGKNPNISVSLDGEWQMIQGSSSDFVIGEWENPIAVNVPGSVHAALLESGIIPDPAYEKNDVFARENSFKDWWMSKTFSIDATQLQQLSCSRLIFGGV